MRATTTVILGYRNIGDAADTGTFHEMTLREALAQLIQYLGQVSMATRIQVTLARNMEEAKRGLGLTVGKGRGSAAANLSLLESLIGDIDDSKFAGTDEIAHTAPPVRDPRDTYQED